MCFLLPVNPLPTLHIIPIAALTCMSYRPGLACIWQVCLLFGKGWQNSKIMAVEIMDERKKKRLGIYSFIPVVAFLLATAYHLFVFRDEVVDKDMEDHIELATHTADHFTSLTIAYGLATAVGVAVLLYFVVHLMRLKHVDPAVKVIWAVLLALLMPLSFPVFWYMMIRKEPRRVEVYPSA